MLHQKNRSAKFPQCPYCYIHHWPHCRGWQQAKIVIFILVMSILLALPIARTSAATNDVWIEDAGLVIIDTNGQGEINHVYKVHCDQPGYTISIVITWLDGAVEYRSSDEWCGAEIYLTGTAATATVTIASVIAPAPEAVYRVWLPVVEK